MLRMVPMKSKIMRRILLFSTLILVLQQSVFSQRVVSADEFNPDDGDNSGRLTSVFKEYYKNNLYDMALESFWALFNEFPDKSEKLYVDGVNMYRHFIQEASDDQDRNNKIDTLMMIYDHRMVHFGGEGNVLGRKGCDLLRFRGSDKAEVEDAYAMLKQSLEIQGDKSREVVLLNYMTAGLTLHKADMKESGQILEDYFMVTGLLDQQKEVNSRRARTRTSIEEMVEKAGILSCEGLDLYFEPKFEQNSSDTALLDLMLNSYTSAGCKQSSVYSAAAETNYELRPDSESAHQLAVLFIGRNDLEKATRYLKMAVVDGFVESEIRAEWFYELSVVSLASGEYCEAITYAREALANYGDFGKPYIALGDAFIASRHQLGDDFQQRSAYWAAADAYHAAVAKNPALAEESVEKLEICAAQYPSSEDIFFQDLKKGANYRVGGCINENTTIRSRD